MKKQHDREASAHSSGFVKAKFNLKDSPLMEIGQCDTPKPSSVLQFNPFGNIKNQTLQNPSGDASHLLPIKEEAIEESTMRSYCESRAPVSYSADQVGRSANKLPTGRHTVKGKIAVLQDTSFRKRLEQVISKQYQESQSRELAVKPCGFYSGAPSKNLFHSFNNEIEEGRLRVERFKAELVDEIKECVANQLGISNVVGQQSDPVMQPQVNQEIGLSLFDAQTKQVSGPDVTRFFEEQVSSPCIQRFFEQQSSTFQEIESGIERFHEQQSTAYSPEAPRDAVGLFEPGTVFEHVNRNLSVELADMERQRDESSDSSVSINELVVDGTIEEDEDVIKPVDANKKFFDLVVTEFNAFDTNKQQDFKKSVMNLIYDIEE